MTKPSLTISLVLCLLLSAGCTNAPKPPTPPRTEPRHYCALTPCRLPVRPALVVTEDWRRAVDELEAELIACALQVRACQERQTAQQPAEL